MLHMLHGEIEITDKSVKLWTNTHSFSCKNNKDCQYICHNCRGMFMYINKPFTGTHSTNNTFYKKMQDADFFYLNPFSGKRCQLL